MYKPAVRREKNNRGVEANVGVYAICEFTANNYLNFAQEPNSAIRMKGSMSGLANNKEYAFRINTLGHLGANCASTGAEFNPLKEVDAYGVPNKF
jgi:hypothetical protein